MCILLSLLLGSVALKQSEDRYGTDLLPFFLDDTRCNGSESNLLKCLPHHNCDVDNNGRHENAGVICLRKGIGINEA